MGCIVLAWVGLVAWGAGLLCAQPLPTAPVEQPILSLEPAVVEMRAAALLMSGQSGGDLWIAAEPFVGELEDDGRLAVTLVVEIPGEELPAAGELLEIFVYGVGPSLEVRDAVTLRLDGEDRAASPSADAPADAPADAMENAPLRALAPLRLDPGLQEIRVLVRAGDRFGLRNLEIDLQDPDAGSAADRQTIALGRSLILLPAARSDELRRSAFPWPALARLPEPEVEAVAAARAEVMLPEDVVEHLEVILDGYLEAIRRRATPHADEGRAPADEYLAELEAQAAERLGPKSLQLLVDLQTEAFRQLRRRIPQTGTLLGLIRLHTDAAEVHRRHARYRLGSLASATAVQLAEIYAEDSQDDEKLAREATWILVSLAARFEERGPLGDAITLYRRALKIDPDDPVALYGLANVLSKTGQPDEAAELFERLVAVDPEHHAARLRLAVMWQRADDRYLRDRVDAQLARLVQSSAPDWIRSLALQQRIRLALDRGVLERAGTLADVGLETWPRHAPFHVARAWVDQALGEPEAARRRILALDPSLDEGQGRALDGVLENGGRTRFHRAGNRGVEEIGEKLAALEAERRGDLAAAVHEVLEKRSGR